MASNISTLVSNKKYHTVSIRDKLSKTRKDYVDQLPQELPPENFWITETICSNAPYRFPPRFRKTISIDQNTKYKQLYSKANGPYTHPGGNHPILTAFLTAYNSHEDVILSPDDIWLLICIGFSQYVNDNAEKLRHLFVNHEDKKSLIIVDETKSEPDWEDFLEKMHQEIGKHVKNDISNLLTNNFSTTTKVESFISSIAIMTTLQKYFKFGYMVGGCAIRNIHFLGTLDDWKLLREKANQLQSFAISGDEFSTYITGLLPVLDQFIETYQGKVDNQFWDTIFDLKHINDISGPRPGTYVNGWFLRLCYGQHNNHRCHMEDFTLKSLVVPVNVVNEETNESKMCYFTGGFHGVESNDGKHKPVMSLAVIEDTKSIKPWRT